MRRRRCGLLVLIAVVLAACGGGGEEAAPSPVQFDVRTETFVDTGRGAARTLETAIYTPRGEVAGRPLVVFAHGSGGNPDFYRVLLEAWAAGGYVVAAPKLPPDHLNGPGDVSFVISELLRLLGGLVDAQRIGVAGHSAGGVTALGVGFNTCCIDRRVRAAAVLATDTPPFPGGTYFTGIHTPLLVVHGVADPTVPVAEGQRIFADALPPKLMLTVPASDVPSADHARPFVGTENRPLADTRVVMATTIGFFDRYLRDDPDAMDRLRKAVDGEIGFRLEVVER
jgi:predicted dienelactone hydrolase